MIGQDAIDHPDEFVTHGHQSALSCAFARRLVLSSFVIGFEMCIMRDEPQGIMIEPVSQVGAAYVRYLWEFSDACPAFEKPNIEASQFDQLFTFFILANIANSGEDGGSGGFADPGQLHEELEVRTLRQQCDGLVEPHLLFAQGIDEVVDEGLDFKRVDAVRVFEADA